MENILHNFLEKLKEKNKDLKFIEEKNLRLVAESIDDGKFCETMDEFKKCLETNEVRYSFITLSDEIASKLMLKSIINSYINTISESLEILWKHDEEVSDESKRDNLLLLQSIGKILYESDDLEEAIELKKSCHVGILDTLIISDIFAQNFVMFADQNKTQLDKFKPTLEILDKAIVKVFLELSPETDDSQLCS